VTFKRNHAVRDTIREKPTIGSLRGDVANMPVPNMPKLPPPHPGEVLREEFLKPLGLSTGKLAKALGVPRTRIERLAAERVDLTS
jgi:hypothetical protein